MHPLLATSYGGLTEGMIALASWAVAILILVLGVVLACTKKWRSVGRRCAIAAAILAIPQFGLGIYLLRGRPMDHQDAIMLGLSISPLVGAGLLLWCSRTNNRAEPAPKTG